MRAEVRYIEANDIPAWPDWQAADELDEHQWFTVFVGPPGDPGADLFQVAVATPRWLWARGRPGRFVGLVVDRFEARAVERAIRDFVASAEGPTWREVARQLASKMRWEYEGLA